MSNLRNLAPWATFALVSAIADWRVAAPAALAVCVAGAIVRRRAHEAPDEIVIAGMAFFGVITVLSGADPTSPVHGYLPALTAAAIGSGMLASVLRGRPFTLPIARRSTTAALWDDPRFLHANSVISMVWASSVLLTAATLGLLDASAPHAAAAAVAVQIAGFVVPMRFTKLYRARLRSRFTAA